MALVSSCRRGALHQRPFLKGILAENHPLASCFLGGGSRGEHQDAKDREIKAELGTKADKGLAASEEAGGRTWMRPFANVFNLVDRQLDYFRPAYEQTKSGTGTGSNEAGAEGKLGRSEEGGSERGSLGGDEGAHASTSFGANNGRRGARAKASKHDVAPHQTNAARSRPNLKANGDNIGNGFAASGVAKAQRLPAGVRKVLEEASKELEPTVSKNYAGKRSGRLLRDVTRSNDDRRRELQVALAKRLMVKGAEGDQADAVEVQGVSAKLGQGVNLSPSGGVSPKLDGEAISESGSSGEPADVQPKGRVRKGKKKGLDGSTSKKVVEDQSIPSEPVAKSRKRRKKGSEKTGASEAGESSKEDVEPAAKRRKTASAKPDADPKQGRKKGRPFLSEATSSSGLEAAGSAQESLESEDASEETGVVSEDGLIRVAGGRAPKTSGENKRKRGRKDASKKEDQEKKLPPMPDARALYVQMLEKEGDENPQPLLTPGKDGGKENAQAILTRFVERGWASDQALALYVNHELFPAVADRFRTLVLRGCTDELGRWFRTAAPSNEAEEALFPLFAELCLQEFRDELRQFRKLVESANMTEPQNWYPYARAMKRKIIYHCGPTNSGKTYEALQRLKQAENGLYCGPLRLLAMEIFDTLNADGVYCNLTTGQERRTVPFANHTSCTVEMAHLGNEYEVAVIDEIQMMADDHRGWAWTRALLGLQAKEIHVCGDSSVLRMLKRIANTCGDELEVRNYERWKPLSVEEASFGGSWEQVDEGDCVVAFSRKEIFQIKDEIEARGKHKCCVIYGALPPETRRQQARLFNDPDSGYNVLVASDAIGMGLNLNIRRMVFAKMEKFSGGAGKDPIPTPMVKQIAGRAGRRNSSHPEGLATTFMPEDLPKLREAMAAPMDTAEKGGLFPIFEQMELFAGQLPDVRFPELLDKFAETSLLDSSYFLCKHDQIRTIANLLEKVPTLRLRDRFSLCQAPINSRSLEAMGTLLVYAKAYAEGTPVPLKVNFRDAADIAELEWKHQVVSAYLWLSFQLEETQFPHRARAEQLLTSMVALLDQRLAGTIRKPARGKLLASSKRPPLQTLVGNALLRKQKLRAEEEEFDRPRVAAVL